MNTKNAQIPELNIVQKWVSWFIGGVIVVVISGYLFYFDGGLSTSHARWGQFGDFVGGIVNPMVGFCTILLLSFSLRQNQIALEQAKSALENAELEIKLTRISMEQASEIQRATEQALREQIAIADHARDMNNAIALWVGIDQQLTPLLEKIPPTAGRTRGATEAEFQRIVLANKLKSKVDKLENIMDLEIDRLATRYPERPS